MLLMLVVLDSIAEDLPNTTVLLTDGKPTVYRQFDPILQRAIALNLDVIINSNGTTPSKKMKICRRLLYTSRYPSKSPWTAFKGYITRSAGTAAISGHLRSIEMLMRAGVRTSVAATAVSTDFLENAAAFIQGLDNLGLNRPSTD